MKELEEKDLGTSAREGDVVGTQQLITAWINENNVDPVLSEEYELKRASSSPSSATNSNKQLIEKGNILHIAIHNCDLRMVEMLVHDLLHQNPVIFKSIVLELFKGTSSVSKQSPLHVAASSFQAYHQISSNNLRLSHDVIAINDQVQARQQLDQLSDNDASRILVLLLNTLSKLCEDQLMKDVLNAQDMDGATPLLTAISHNAPVYIIQLLLSAGCNMNHRDIQNRNSLHLAIIQKNYDLTKFILRSMEDADTKADRPKDMITLYDRDSRGYNAMHYAAYVGSSKIAEQLIVSSLNIDPTSLLCAESKDGKAPYYIAVMKKHMDVAALISQELPPQIIEEVNAKIDRDVENEKHKTQSTGGSECSCSSSSASSSTEVATDSDTKDLDAKTHKRKSSASSYLDSLRLTITHTYQKARGKNSPKEEPVRIGMIRKDIPKSKITIEKSHLDKERDGIMTYVKALGYPIEKHHVMTEDGFVLYMYRIPHGKSTDLLGLPRKQATNQNRKKRPVVFLQHGVCNSSSTWVVTGEKQALAFILAMAGFDVWMGNNRGTQFGRTHLKYEERNVEYWKFSWDQMAKYDLPAQINYVLEKTQASTLSYVGHSQGTAQAFAAFSTNPELQSKINLFIALAPVVCLKNQSSQIFKILASFKTEALITMLGIGEIAQTQISRSLLPRLATKLVGTTGFNDLWSLFMDCDIDHAALPVLTLYEPSPTSVQNLAHWSQLVRSGKFHAYDYGEAGNMTHYGQATPLIYDLKNVTIPVAAFYGDLDYLANPTDVEAFLLKELPNVVCSMKIENFKHNDFVWGKDAWHKVYKYAIDLLLQVTTSKVDNRENLPTSLSSSSGSSSTDIPATSSENKLYEAAAVDSASTSAVAINELPDDLLVSHRMEEQLWREETEQQMTDAI